MSILKLLVVVWWLWVLYASTYAMTIKDSSYFTSYQIPSQEVLRTKLTQKQYDVTQRNDTDAWYMSDRSYVENHKDGVYVDIVSWQPLFSSKDKYDSQTGRPAFTRPIDSSAIITKVDWSDNMIRTEVRSAVANSHLGHIFEDGPSPDWLRYCINSSSLRFISKKHMKELWYGWYLYLFK